MAEITIEKCSRKAKDLFHKGFAAMERGNVDYAINLLFECVKVEPQLLQARKFLRVAEVQKAKKVDSSGLSRAMGKMRSLPAQLKINGMIRKGNVQEAVMACEELLREDPVNLAYVNLFVSAAIKAELPEAAAMTIEAVRERFPDDVEMLRKLGELYQAVGDHANAKACFEHICELKPNDPDSIRQLKNAMALDSMHTDGWKDSAEKGGSYRDIMKDSREAVLLEQESKAVKSERDADNLIGDMLQKIAAEPANVNYYRALSRLYVQRKMFEDAVATLQRALEVNPGDPEVENSLSNLHIQRFDSEIQELKNAGDEAGAAAKETERTEFVFNDLQDRVKRYPNDHKLRYDWGVQLYERQQFNDAIQQFQFAQRNPRYKVLSLYYIGMCFEQKQQFDLAAEQLQKAMDELPTMDATKKSVCYELGRVLEGQGDLDRAMECFKQIYQVDIGYRDISQKMEQLYRR
jgi:tetratricopeptide (TPR) repeat protein